MDFLRVEAPLELERQRSLGRLATLSTTYDGDQSVPAHRSYGRWLREAYGLFSF